MNNLYVLKYNNYYNRIFKKHNSVLDYSEYILGSLSNVNFKPNDYVNAEQILNLWQMGISEPFDYLIVTDIDNNIESRWFVIEAGRTTTGQDQLTLRRDLIADYYDSIIDAPCFIEKATLQANDPMIFNKENMTYNQIKTSETLLKDSTQCPWLVGYFARYENDDIRQSYSISLTENGEAFEQVEGIENWEYFTYISNNFNVNSTDTTIRFKVTKSPGIGTAKGLEYTATRNYCTNNNTGESSKLQYFYTKTTSTAYPTNEEITNALDFDVINSIVRRRNNYKSITDLTSLRERNNKLLKDTDTNIIYRISVNLIRTEESPEYYVNADNGADYTNIANMILDLDKISDSQRPAIWYKSQLDVYRISLTIENTEQLTVSLPITRNKLTDAPYDMIAIPYMNYTGNGISLTKTVSMAVMNEFASQFSGAEQLYDIQLLPFCPCLEYGINKDVALETTLSTLELDTQYSKSTIDNEIKCVVFYPTQSKFTFDIEHVIPVESNNIESKIKSETEFYRLCSPDYASQFEFNAQMNGGVDYFNVDCFYQPHNPYIHINPNFGNLYGQDFNDARGLICGGDFSLPILSNAWNTYQLNNKNYQLMFDRQIQNMRVNQNMQRLQDILGGASSALGMGVGAGMLTGSVGMGIGAGVISGLAGIADFAVNEKLRNEAMDYTKDMFGYSLGNIQAQAETLARVSSFSNNNKIFPVLEYYTCTEVEKQALRDKIKYNGMSVGRIGTIREYLQEEESYIKGQLIRLDEVIDDYHLLKEISIEINKGVFI